LEDAMRFLSEALGADGYVHREDEPKLYDPKGKAAVSKPYRPAIYIE